MQSPGLTKLTFGVVPLTLITSFGCKSSTESTASSKLRDSTPHHAELYGNDGSTENELWNGDCKIANSAANFRQSPIALESSMFAAGSAEEILKFSINGPGIADIVDNGHTIKVNFATSPGSIAASGETFSLKQFHFHAQSEHTLDGRHSPLETHFVFMNQSGTKAVALGFMSWPDAPATPSFLVPLESVLAAQGVEKLAHGVEKAIAKNLKLDLGSHFGAMKGDFFTYEGSLTTPPCSQVVTHMVYKNPVPVSASFLNAFKKFYSNNFRKLQDPGNATVRNLRTVKSN